MNTDFENATARQIPDTADGGCATSAWCHTSIVKFIFMLAIRASIKTRMAI